MDATRSAATACAMAYAASVTKHARTTSAAPQDRLVAVCLPAVHLARPVAMDIVVQALTFGAVRLTNVAPKGPSV